MRPNNFRPNFFLFGFLLTLHSYWRATDGFTDVDLENLSRSMLFHLILSALLTLCAGNPREGSFGTGMLVCVLAAGIKLDVASIYKENLFKTTIEPKQHP